MESTSYSRNQCSLMIRVDGDEIEFPINFGMTAEEIRNLYPFIVSYTNRKILNPAVQFSKDARQGKYNTLSDEEYLVELNKVKHLAKYWYGKHEESLLAIALRYALDINISGFATLVAEDLNVANLANVKADDITDEEVEKVSKELGLTSEYDDDFDPGDEQDIALGTGGNLSFSLYSDDDSEADFLSEELDHIESKLDVKDKFKEVIDKDIDEIEPDKYKTQYKAGEFKDGEQKDGCFTMYEEDEDKSDIWGDDKEESEPLDDESDEEIDDDEDVDDIPDADVSDLDEESEEEEDDEYVDEEDVDEEPDEEDIPDDDVDSLLDDDEYDYDMDEDELINGKKDED